MKREAHGRAHGNSHWQTAWQRDGGQRDAETVSERQGRPHLPSILVVDDDPEMRGYVRRCLASVCGGIVEARDGAEALALVREAGPGAFDLIVADVVMPGMDGLSLRDALATDPELGAPPV